MTGTLSPAIPTVGDPDSSEEPKIPSAIIVLRDGLNAILTPANQIDGAQIGAGTIPVNALGGDFPLSRITAGADAQIPISNGTDYVAKTLTGDVTVDDAGLTAIATGVVGTTELGDDSVTNDKLNLSASNDNLAADLTSLSSVGYTQVAGLTLVVSSSYLVFGQVQFSQQTVSVGSASVVRVNLTFNNTTHESPNITVVGDQVVPLSFAIVVDASHTALNLQAKSISGGAVDVKGTTGSGFSFSRLCAIRYS